MLIARALAQRGRVLVMDEPTASLGFGNRLRLLGLLRQLTRDGVGIVWTTHEPAQAAALADRVLLLAQGGVPLAYGPARLVVTPDNLERLYGVPVAEDCRFGG